MLFRSTEAQDGGEGAEECGLAETGDAFEKDVAAGEEADQDAIDDVLLADDAFRYFRADAVEFTDRL